MPCSLTCLTLQLQPRALPLQQQRRGAVYGAPAAQLHNAQRAELTWHRAGTYHHCQQPSFGRRCCCCSISRRCRRRCSCRLQRPAAVSDALGDGAQPFASRALLPPTPPPPPLPPPAAHALPLPRLPSPRVACVCCWPLKFAPCCRWSGFPDDGGSRAHACALLIFAATPSP